MATTWVDGTTPLNATNMNDIEDRISALETLTTRTSISSSVSMVTDDDNVTDTSVNSAYYKSGWVYLAVRAKVTTTSITTIGNISSPYRPPVTVRGYMMIHNVSADNGKCLDCYVNSSGTIAVRLNSSLSAAEHFVIIYPV